MKGAGQGEVFVLEPARKAVVARQRRDIERAAEKRRFQHGVRLGQLAGLRVVAQTGIQVDAAGETHARAVGQVAQTPGVDVIRAGEARLEDVRRTQRKLNRQVLPGRFRDCAQHVAAGKLNIVAGEQGQADTLGVVVQVRADVVERAGLVGAQPREAVGPQIAVGEVQRRPRPQ